MSEKTDYLDSEFAKNFFAPLLKAAGADHNTRRCPKHSDLNFAADGVLRILAQCRSGRDFLQQRLK